MQNREELRQKGHDGSQKTTCRGRGKNIIFRRGGGINIVFRPKYRPLQNCKLNFVLLKKHVHVGKFIGSAMNSALVVKKKVEVCDSCVWVGAGDENLLRLHESDSSQKFRLYAVPTLLQCLQLQNFHLGTGERHGAESNPL